MREIAAQELLQHTDFVRQIARALVADEHSADDLVQDAWVAALSSRGPAPRSLRAWLAGVVRNAARQGHRGRARRAAREELAARDERQPSTADVVERMETHRRVVSAVLELPSKQREVLVLRYFDGLPPRRIAARLGVPVETVRTREKRAREELRAQLDAQHGSSHACLVALAGLARSEALATSVASGAGASVGIVSIGVAGALTATALLLAVPLLAESKGTREELAQPAPPHVAAVPSLGTGEALAAGSARAERSPGSTGRREPAAQPGTLVDPGSGNGRIVVVDNDGRERQTESGSFYLRPVHPDGSMPEPAELVHFHDGRFLLQDLPLGTLQVERAVGTDGRAIEFVNAQFERRAGEDFVVRGRYLPTALLHVLDAETDAPLERVSMLPVSGSSRHVHPGPHTSSQLWRWDATETQPLRLPSRRGMGSYWVTASDYTWRFLIIDHQTGGERTVRLERAGSLAVQTAGHAPDLALRLRVYQAGTSDVAVGCKLDCSEERTAFQGFSGLPPGPYDVRVEVDRPGEAPLVFAQARAVVPLGGTAEVFLDTGGSPVTIPAPVEVRIRLALPRVQRDVRVALRLSRADGPALRERDTQRIPPENMSLDADTGELVCWSGHLTPGRYAFVVSPIQHGGTFDVTPAADEVRIDVPELVEIVVHAVDEHSGTPVEGARLRFARELPPGLGSATWSYLGTEAGTARWLAPAGRLFVAGDGPSHGQRFLDELVGPGGAELTLELPARIKFEVVLVDGETHVPWSPDMPCELQRGAAGSRIRCGSDGQGRMFGSVEEPGTYEVVVGPVDGYASIEPTWVTLEAGHDTERVVVRLRR